ncbi:MAG: DNA polymerase III subunit delta [Rhodospirillales bacterium]
MKVAPRDIERFLSMPPQELCSCLIYGEDAGQVRELAKKLAETVVDDLNDPFRVTTLDVSNLTADPSRLSDEQAAMPFGGGRRLIRLRGITGDHARLISETIQEPSGDGLIIAEAGPLRRDSAMVKMFEASKTGAAIPCYADEGRSLAVLLDQTLKQENISLTPDARSYVINRLGADRAATRSEIEKLLLYIGKNGKLDLEDAVDAIGDAGSTSVDDLVYATATGDITSSHRALDRLTAANTQPITVIRSMIGHLTKLRAVVAKAETSGLEPALASIRPPIFFKRKTAFQEQARIWSRQRLSLAIDRMLRAEIEVKQTGSDAYLALWKACYDVAQAATTQRHR